MENLRILFAASEVVPFAKTGGLADVAGSLPKELKKIGQDVRIVMPKYGCISKEYTDKMEYVGYTYVNMGWRHQYCGIFKLLYDGIIVYFIDNEYYFNRLGLYGYNDEGEQFTFFSKALIEMLPVIGFKPDIIHCNDWQTGVVSLLLQAHYSHLSFYEGIKTVYTIHNLKYQGVFPKEVLRELLSVGWEYFTDDKIEFYDQVNFMKSGIVFSDAITTVSKTYAEEIKCDFFGENLNIPIHHHAGKLYGILNGIDNETNDPASDQRLYANFTADNLAPKYMNKKNLQKDLGLPQKANTPVIGIISRLVDQKGFDLIAQVLPEILALDLQIIVLGSGEYRYECMFKQAAADFPGKLSANIKYDGVLAQRIYAGSDMFLMPSLFEPCGLSQLFSLRYGTIPIVRETGGLNDTIQSYNELTQEGNGFTFSNYNSYDMVHTLKRALSFYKQKKIWQGIVKKGMQQDFSWTKSAQEYVDLYDKLFR